MAPLLQKILFRWWLVSRGMTLGVRAILLDAEKHVLLVRHTYTPGWHFPGGGVDPGETVEEALRRECLEEAGVEIGSLGQLHGIFHNRCGYRRDHVAVFVVRDWKRLYETAPSHEIAEVKNFAIETLPENISPGSKQRLLEIFQGAPRSSHWS